MHLVINVQPCIKIAFKVLRVEEAAGAPHSHSRLRCGCNGLPQDYMCIIQHVVDELLAWVPFMCRGSSVY